MIVEEKKEVVVPVEPPAPVPTSDETPPSPEAPKGEDGELQDIDFAKELGEVTTVEPPKPKRTEKEKAEYSLHKILEKHPDLKTKVLGEPATVVDEDEDEEDVAEKVLGNLQAQNARTQAEGIIRQQLQGKGVKDMDSAVKFYLAHYDKLPKTASIFEDVDNAIWLANKKRTQNALKELRRTPPENSHPSGSGAKPPKTDIPELPPSEIKKLVELGLKQTAPGVWEGNKVIIKYNKAEGKWEQLFK